MDFYDGVRSGPGWGLGKVSLIGRGRVESACVFGAGQDGDYRSPYRLAFRHSVEELAVGFDRAPWNSAAKESSLPVHEWSDRHIERKYGAWGPPARQYPAPPGLSRRESGWLQERVILAASRWIGHVYQHHHIPDWQPPAHWPWHKVAYGRNSPGIDCSNFSSFYYNYALGIKLDTGIHTQAARLTVRGPGGRGVLTISRLNHVAYPELVAQLQPADLLYIKNDAGRVAHVIMWLGHVGVAPDRVPLVIDSTGGGHRDCLGQAIPIGVHIRPFAPESWYARDFSHAHRIIRGVSEVREGEVPEAEEGGALDV
jgi:cell wall-associated NlpC family hydrolase